MQEENNLLSKAQEGYAFIILLRDYDDARGLASFLEDVSWPQVSTIAVFVTPPVRGVDFFESHSTSQLEEWCATNISPTALPIYLLEHEKGLAKWLNALPGIFYIGVPNYLVGQEYEETAQIITFLSNSPLDFATVVMRDFNIKFKPDAGLFDAEEAIRVVAINRNYLSSVPPSWKGSLRLTQVDKDDNIFPSSEVGNLRRVLVEAQVVMEFKLPPTHATITPTMVFTEINDRIQANPEQSPGINATYKFVLSGSGGGDYFIALADGTGEAGQGIVDNPDITISMTSNDFVDMATGKLEGTKAFMRGKIKIEGNMALAMMLQKVFE